MKSTLERLRTSESGVAMVTVLFIGAVLTVSASTAAYMTIDELRSATDDRKAAEALAYAEAGIDRLILELRRGGLSWGDIREAGCAQPPLSLPTGHVGGVSVNATFDVYLTVYEPSQPAASRTPTIPWSAANDAEAPCTLRSNEVPRQGNPQTFAIISTGRHPTAKRIVRQEVAVTGIGLPIGLYADTVNTNGNGSALSISLVTPGDIQGREKIGFSGFDPYYRMSDMYDTSRYSVSNEQVPAAAHAVGSIYYVQGGGSRQEHPPSPNCVANDSRGDLGQSLWDGSGRGADFSSLPPGCSPAAAAAGADVPPSSLFSAEDLRRTAPTPQLSEQDYLALRDAARSSGLYCTHSSTGARTCTVAGQSRSIPETVQGTCEGATYPCDGDLAGLPNEFIAYFEFAPGTNPFGVSNEVKWKGAVRGCSYDQAANRAGILIVRNGSLSIQNGAYLNGATLVPEGRFDSAGSFTSHGTIIAKELVIRGGATFENSQCWLDNMPGAFLDVSPGRWAELDR